MPEESQSILDTRRLLRDVVTEHLLGSLASTDLNVNVLVFTSDEGVGEHTNAEVDVLLVALEGEGVVRVDDEETRLTAGQVMIIPKGSARAIRSDGDRFAYLTCHGRRAGLMPTVGERQASTDSPSDRR